MTRDTELPVTQAEAIMFCESALRNVGSLRLSRLDIADIAGALTDFRNKAFARHRIGSTPVSEEIACSEDVKERVRILLGHHVYSMGSTDEIIDQILIAAMPPLPNQGSGDMPPIDETKAAAKFKHWLFKECNEGTRRHLWSIFGLPVDEITTHGTEYFALKYVMKSLRAAPGLTARLVEVLGPLVEMYDTWKAGDLNYEAAHHAFVGWQTKYDVWEKARALLTEAKGQPNGIR